MTTTSKNEKVELSTFPSDDRYFAKLFKVPKDWLIDILDRLDQFNEQRGVDLENFLENYVWDETWFIYLRAKAEGKIFEEREV